MPGYEHSMTDVARSYETKEQQYFRNVRSEILPLLPAHVDRVVEIGCGGGYTLEHLRRTGRCQWTCGVELFPDAAQQARQRVDEVYEGNIEQLELPLAPSSIDVILCLDVLEHLVDPWRVVRKLHRLLKPGGIVVASIPNVRHYSVVLPLLLKGRWDYTPSGLLDRTHLRFFTQRTALALLESSGLKVDKADAVWRTSRMARLLNAATFSLARPWLDFQFLLRARRLD
jgi:SAM-dependent methyltransferase